MARRVFFSFHYGADAWRASQVRNIGAIEGNKPASDNDWETVKRGGDKAIQNWIDGQLNGRSCTVVLIGTDTANRPWVKYEIEKSWNLGKGLLGVHVHNLQDANQRKAVKGRNPFDDFVVNGKTPMSSIVKAYDPQFTDSRQVYAHIQERLSTWIDEAVLIRSAY